MDRLSLLGGLLGGLGCLDGIGEGRHDGEAVQPFQAPRQAGFESDGVLARLDPHPGPPPPPTPFHPVDHSGQSRISVTVSI
jgi:hypothetical protein